MWMLIDNYDSFTHILHHYLLQLHSDIVVCRNDAVTVEQITLSKPERIILSPGPQTPAEAGVTNQVIQAFHQSVPLLGICLGHQALGQFFGAALVKARTPMHGKISLLRHNGSRLFRHVPPRFEAMRYHSLILEHWEHTGLEPLAFTDRNELMAFQHHSYPLTGLQFHPESILTPQGMQLLRNWHEQCNEKL